jgi:hypothetical protein
MIGSSGSAVPSLRSITHTKKFRSHVCLTQLATILRRLSAKRKKEEANVRNYAYIEPVPLFLSCEWLNYRLCSTYLHAT